MESAATGGSAMAGCRSKAAFGKCLQQVAKRHSAKQYSAARGTCIYNCKKLLPEYFDRTDPLKMNAFHEQYSKSVSELTAIGEKMPSESTLMKTGTGAITVDESVANSKLRVNGEKMVFNEDLYDVVEPAFLEAKAENPTLSLKQIIEKTKEKFGAKGPEKYRNYHLRAASLDYLDPSVPEPNDVARADILQQHSVLQRGVLQRDIPQPDASQRDVPQPDASQRDVPQSETALTAAAATARGAPFPHSTAPFGALTLPDTMSTEQMTALGAGIASGIASSLGSGAGAQPGIVNFNMPIGGSGINFGSQTNIKHVERLANNNNNNSSNNNSGNGGTNGNGTNSSPLASRSQVSELLQRVDELGNTIAQQPQQTAAAVTETITETVVEDAVTKTVKKMRDPSSEPPVGGGTVLDDSLAASEWPSLQTLAEQHSASAGTWRDLQIDQVDIPEETRLTIRELDSRHLKLHDFLVVLGEKIVRTQESCAMMLVASESEKYSPHSEAYRIEQNFFDCATFSRTFTMEVTYGIAEDDVVLCIASRVDSVATPTTVVLIQICLSSDDVSRFSIEGPESENQTDNVMMSPFPFNATFLANLLAQTHQAVDNVKLFKIQKFSIPTEEVEKLRTLEGQGLQVEFYQCHEVHADGSWTTLSDSQGILSHEEMASRDVSWDDGSGAAASKKTTSGSAPYPPAGSPKELAKLKEARRRAAALIPPNWGGNAVVPDQS